MTGGADSQEGNGNGDGGAGSGGRRVLSKRLASRRRSDLVGGMRRLAERPRGPAQTVDGTPRIGSGPASAEGSSERCELCGAGLPADHRHLIHLDERRLLCACETCWSTRSGEASYRPAGVRIEWLDDFELPDEAWASFSIPVGLAFFMRTGDPDRVVSFYPSPAGATESEIDAGSWERVRALNPSMERLEPDSEALIVNRISEPHQHAVVPIDECYRLVGMIKSSWEGISGGSGPELAIERFFAELRVKAATGGGSSGLRGFGGDV